MHGDHKNDLLTHLHADHDLTQVKSVVLYHYVPRDPAAYVTRVKNNFSGSVFASADLERYCLGSTGVSTSHSELAPGIEHGAAQP
jgi:hypothetical protein